MFSLHLVTLPRTLWIPGSRPLAGLVCGELCVVQPHGAQIRGATREKYYVGGERTHVEHTQVFCVGGFKLLLRNAHHKLEPRHVCCSASHSRSVCASNTSSWAVLRVLYISPGVQFQQVVFNVFQRVYLHIPWV